MRVLLSSALVLTLLLGAADCVAATGADRGNASVAVAAVRQRTARQRKDCGIFSPFQCAYVDHFNRQHERWRKSNGYANGNPFGSWWSAGNAQFQGGESKLKLGVGKQWAFGHAYSSGEVRTEGWHGYGCYEVRMKPAYQKGLISTFFTYTGPYNNASGYAAGHNEIDIEFVWSHSRKKLMLQCNFFTDSKGKHEKWINLPFEPHLQFHNYAFKWTKYYIKWYVDGKHVHTAWDKPHDQVPKLWKFGPHRLYMNLWVVSKKNSAWGGLFQWQGWKTSAYEAMRFTPGNNCQIKNRF